MSYMLWLRTQAWCRAKTAPLLAVGIERQSKANASVAHLLAALEMVQLLAFALSADLALHSSLDWLAYMGTLSHAWPRSLGPEAVSAIFVVAAVLSLSMCMAVAVAVWQSQDIIPPAWHTRVTKFWSFVSGAGFLALGRPLLSGVECLMDSDDALPFCRSEDSALGADMRAVVGTLIFSALLVVTLIHNAWGHDMRYSSAAPTAQAPWSFATALQLCKFVALLGAVLLPGYPGARVTLAFASMLTALGMVVLAQPFYRRSFNQAHAIGLGAVLGASSAAFVAVSADAQDAANVAAAVWMLTLCGAALGALALYARTRHIRRMADAYTSDNGEARALPSSVHLDLMVRALMHTGKTPVTAHEWSERREKAERAHALFEEASAGDVVARLVQLNFLLTWARGESTRVLVVYRQFKSQADHLSQWLVYALYQLERERRLALIEAVGETSSEYQRDLRACTKAHHAARLSILAFWKVLLVVDAETSSRLNKAALRVEKTTTKANKRYLRLLKDYPELSGAQRAYGFFQEEIMSNPDYAVALYRRAEGHGDTDDDSTSETLSAISGASSYRSGAPSLPEGVSVAGIAKRRAQSITGSMSQHGDLMRLDEEALGINDGEVSGDDAGSAVQTTKTKTSLSSGRFQDLTSRAMNRKYRERLGSLSANESFYMLVKTVGAIVVIIVLACVILALSVGILHDADVEMNELHKLGEVESLVYHLDLQVRRMEHAALADGGHGHEGAGGAFASQRAVARQELHDVEELWDELLFSFEKNGDIAHELYEEPIVYELCFVSNCVNRTYTLAVLGTELFRRIDRLLDRPREEWVDFETFESTDDFQYVNNNLLWEFTPRVEGLLKMFEHKLEASIDDAVLTQWALVASATAVLLVLAVAVFRPAINKLRHDQQNIANLFLAIPMMRVTEILDSLRSTMTGVDNRRDDKSTSRSLRRIDEMALRHNVRHTRRYIGVLFLVGMVFIASFAIRSTLLSSRRDTGHEMLAVIERSDAGLRMRVMVEELTADSAQARETRDRVVRSLMTTNPRFQELHLALLFGDSTLGLSGAATRSNKRHRILFDNVFTFTRSTGEVVEFEGAHNLLQEYSVRVDEFAADPAQWSGDSPLHSDIDEMAMLLDTVYPQLEATYEDEDRGRTDFLRALEGALFAVLIVALAMGVVVSFRPLLSEVKREGNRMRSQLLLIPSHIVNRIDVVREFLEAEGGVGNRLKVEQGLQMSNLMEVSPDTYVVSTVSGSITYINQAASNMFGYERDEVVGKNVNVFMPAGMASRHQKYMDNASHEQLRNAHARRMLDLRLQNARHKDGHIFPVLITILHITQNGQPLVVAVMRAAEKEAESDDLRTKAFMCDAATDVVLSMDTDGTVLRANRVASELFRRSNEEFIDASISTLVRHERQGAHGEDDGEVLAPVVSLIRSNSTELVGVRSDGSTFPLEISSAEVEREGKLIVVSILRDCTARKAVADDLIKANQMRAASNAKSAFLANMSHEIRTPLNGIIGMNQMILDDPDLPDQAREYAEVVSHSADSLLVIVNDILDLSKLDAGKVRIEETEMEVTALVEEVVMSNMSKVAGSNVTLSCTALPGMVSECHVLGDPTRIKQVVNNVVSNAVKFTQTGFVRVTARRLRETASVVTLAIEVEDTGIGMTEAQQKKLFSRFAQADESTTRKFGGTGLGLSISKQLVEMMGGTIEVRSTIGQGSTFSIELPLKKCARTTLLRKLDATHPLARSEPRVMVIEREESLKKMLEMYFALFVPRARMTFVQSELEGADVLRRYPQDLIVLRESAVPYALSHHWAPRRALLATRSFTAKSQYDASGPPGVAFAFSSLPLPLRKMVFLRTLTSLLDGGADATAAAGAGAAGAGAGAGAGADSANDARARPVGAWGDLNLSVGAGGRPRSDSDSPRLLHTPAGSPGGMGGMGGTSGLQSMGGSSCSLLSDASEQTDEDENVARVLIAEDQKINQKVLTSILRRAGYHYDSCNNGSEALERYRNAAPGTFACVLMDCQMPVMDGYTAARAIRELEANEPSRGHITIIAVTAHAMDGEKQKCLRAGMDLFQTKPYRKQQLLRLLERVVGGEEGHEGAAAALDGDTLASLARLPASPTPPATRHLLVATSAALSQGVEEAMRGALGHMVDVCVGADAARQCIATRPPDVLVCDVALNTAVHPTASGGTCVLVGVAPRDGPAGISAKQLGMDAVVKSPRSPRGWLALVTRLIGSE